jgi:exodeoxyribonuclease VII large subunit
MRYAGSAMASPGDREMPLSVEALVRVAAAALERHVGVVWVEGEASTLRTPGSGHIYFVLKDGRAQLPAVMWRSDAQRLRTPLADGERFVCRGRLGVYPDQGKVQLYVDLAEPVGAGAAAARLAELRRRLAAEGLFDPARKRALPRFPRRIGVVTSASGAAVKDIVRAVWRRFPTPILVSPCKVQGEGAAADVAWAVRRLGRTGVDVVIVGRGGGSAEDLSAFNEEPVVRAIVHCPVPVVSAVGHEIDVTLADLAADARAATPTAAGELCVPVRAQLADELAVLERRLIREVHHGLARTRAGLERLAGQLVHPGRRLALQRQQLDELFMRMLARDPRARLRAARTALGAEEARARAALGRALNHRAVTLAALGARLDALSPLRVLDRGYAVVRDETGQVVTSATQVARGDALSVRLADGTIEVTVR